MGTRLVSGEVTLGHFKIIFFKWPQGKIRLTRYLGRYDKCDPLSQLRVRIREK